MSRLTTDPNDSDLNQPQDHSNQNKAYLVLSDEEKEKGFIRPVRVSYVHTECGQTTTMAEPIAETYARNPNFYTGTFCTTCMEHLPVSEFTWLGTDEIVGS